MGKIKAHGIVFEGTDQLTVDAGSEVQGHVFLQLEEPLKVRGIRIKFRGKAKTQISEMRTEHERDGDVEIERRIYTIYTSEEDYLNKSILLFGISPEQGNATTEIPPGDYKFPFTFTLPRNLPAPFQGEYGFIKYHVKSKIDLPFKLDPKVKQPFYVRPIADLNSDPDNRYGLHGENDKFVCCLCCKSGPITASFKILQQGFVPGEAIKIFAEINNHSNRRIDMTSVKLKREATFTAESKTKSETVEIAEVTRPGIDPYSRDNWEGQPLIVPLTPPSGCPGCGIITVRYTLKLKVSPAWSLSLEIPFDITIGTTPLRQQEEEEVEEPQANIPAPGPMDLTPVPYLGFPYYPTAPPPDYGECVPGRDNQGYVQHI